jgi:hypothetical protein
VESAVTQTFACEARSSLHVVVFVQICVHGFLHGSTVIRLLQDSADAGAATATAANPSVTVVV